MVVNGKLRSLLRDILSQEAAGGGSVICPKSWSLVWLRLTMQRSTDGEAVANFQHRALVANIIEEVILGTNLLTKFSFLLEKIWQ